MGDEVPSLRLSEVSHRCGIDLETLRALVNDDQLKGVVRSGNGHVYLREDAVPTYQELVGVLEAQLRRHLARAQGAHRRVQAEIEAVGNDLAMAVEDPYAELGDDLTAFWHHASVRDRSTLASALSRLEGAAWDVRTYSEALRKARAVI